VKFLPQTDVRLLRFVVVVMVIACLWFAVTCLRPATFDQYYFGALSLVLWLPLAVGLWLLMPWARYLSLSVLWLIVIATPTVVGPWEAINGDAPPLPVWEQLMYSVAPLFIPAVFCIEVLYAYKGEFSWPRASRPVEGVGYAPTMLPRSWILWCTGMFVIPVLLVALLNLDMRLAGGCISISPTFGHGPRYHWVFREGSVWVCAILGAFVVLRAAPASASRCNKIVRALAYTAGMLWFGSNVVGYLTVFGNLCE
jgi:hypothetical protein